MQQPGAAGEAAGGARGLPLRYTSGMALVGRRREMAEVGRLLDGAADGRGGVLAITGPPGSGRTELAAAAARAGARRGFEVPRAAAIGGQPASWRGRGCCETPARLMIWPPACSVTRARWSWTALPACWAAGSGGC